MRRPWFAFRLVAASLVAAGLAATPAAADRDCNVPLADWQPREALQKKLEAEGWTVLSIRSDDGCYKVRATNAQGGRLKAKFDPARLERVPGRDEDD
ncbi:PepSY domain-containing protein [Xanthobacter flavus]|uniref:PepSY domain-containing protein n=1 Tax=Xanthobacter TaxID=279 RepID=UPI00372CD4D7